MNSAAQVTELIAQWRLLSPEKAEMVAQIAEACIGWPYVFGAAGQMCTPSTRRSYAKNYETRNPAEAEVILKKCQVCRESDPKGSCSGCKWYPGGSTRCFDCRGFTRWVLAQVGINLKGAGATSQWNTAANWSEKGEIANIPEKVCCIFIRKGATMSHTGFYIGNGWVIHCSGEVKKEKLSAGKWTNYALVSGLEGEIPVPAHATIRRGSTGAEVVECQEDLIRLGYDLSPYGADGKFGAKTESAVKAFQRASGLTADGIVGPKTWEALEKAVGPDPEPQKRLYTVIIPHLTEEQAEELQKTYPDAEKRIEGGGSQ